MSTDFVMQVASLRWSLALRLFTGLFVLLLAAPVAAQPVRTGHVTAELVADHAALAPGMSGVIALRQQLDPRWHTYWRNPGDSGEPTRIEWRLPEGVAAGEIVWPFPKPIRVGPLVNYGYEDEVFLFVPLAIAPDVPHGPMTLEASATWLVCEEICIPEEAKLTLDLEIGPAARRDPYWAPRLEEAEARLPAPSPWDAGYLVEDETLKLWLAAPELTTASPPGLHFFPEGDGLIVYAAPQIAAFGSEGISLSVAANFGAADAHTSGEPLRGLLVVSERLADGSLAERAFEIEARAAPALPAGFATTVLAAPPGAKPGIPSIGLWAALGLAFLGGLLLNLMPCVFPVLFLKGLSLLHYRRGERALAAAHGLVFTVGVLATFLVIAGALLALRAAGESIGWGFQLQSAPVVAALALLMLGVGLNLSGVFSVGGALSGSGDRFTRVPGFLGSFFTGALAVVVATPCTAPFMAVALGAALTAPPATALSIFASLGLGLAMPFLLLSSVPGALRLLPEPGSWMEGLRKLLAFPIYATAAWLLWVLAQQTGPGGFALVLAAALLLAFGAWLLGATQTRGGAWPALAGVAVLAAFALVLAMPARERAPARLASAPVTSEGSLASEPYSEARVAEAREQGRAVFVNFTAAWCITCLVNERVAFSDPAVKRAFAAANILYLKGDWTSRDDAITQALARFGRAGVPLYVFYPAAGGEPVILPQILSASIVLEAIGAAPIS